MYAQMKKPKENKNRLITNPISYKKRNTQQPLQFMDNCQDTILQKKMQKKIIQRVIKWGKRGDYANAKSRVEKNVGAPTASNTRIWDRSTRPGWINYKKLVKYLGNRQNGRLNERQEQVCDCGECGRTVHARGIHVGHVYGTGWKSYLESFQGNLTQEEAQVLYNDPRWLQIEHSGCGSRRLEKRQGVTRSRSKEVPDYMWGQT